MANMDYTAHYLAAIVHAFTLRSLLFSGTKFSELGMQYEC